MYALPFGRQLKHSLAMAGFKSTVLPAQFTNRTARVQEREDRPQMRIDGGLMAQETHARTLERFEFSIQKDL